MLEGQDRVAAVIVAGGSGRRFGRSGGLPKQYQLLAGAPVLAWSIEPFVCHPAIIRTVVVVPEQDLASPPEWLATLPITLVGGGRQRGDSVRNGISLLEPEEFDLVLIHDGARPLVSRDLIDRLIASWRGIAVIPGLPTTDTLKEVDDTGLVRSTVDRGRYWGVQTPQAFPLATLREVYRRAAADSIHATDDAALFERYELPVHVIPGEPMNLKMTLPIDLEIAELLARRLPRPR